MSTTLKPPWLGSAGAASSSDARDKVEEARWLGEAERAEDVPMAGSEVASLGDGSL